MPDDRGKKFSDGLNRAESIWGTITLPVTAVVFLFFLFDQMPEALLGFIAFWAFQAGIVLLLVVPFLGDRWSRVSEEYSQQRVKLLLLWVVALNLLYVAFDYQSNPEGWAPSDRHTEMSMP